jgi:hypothetical protein
MLTLQQLLNPSRPRRRHRSAREQYDAYVMARIEHYKNSISRDELFRLMETAHAEQPDNGEDQFVLTEVVADEMMNELIKRRLGIRKFSSWRRDHSTRRAAQQSPEKWGVDPAHIMAGLAQRIEPDDPVLVVGAGAEGCAYLAAAHEADVTYLDRSTHAVERAELRVASESLTCEFLGVCVQFDGWLPHLRDDFVLVVVDSGTLSALSPGMRRTLLHDLQRLTAPGGLHALVPDQSGTGPEGFAGHYAEWQREPLPPAGRRVRSAPPRGAVFLKPASVSTTRGNEAHEIGA